MIDVKFSIQVQKKITYYRTRNVQLAKKIEKQLKLFSLDPSHPSLRKHKLSGEFSNAWSISIDRSIRMMYTMLSDERAYFVMIGTHDEIYRKQ